MTAAKKESMKVVLLGEGGPLQGMIGPFTGA